MSGESKLPVALAELRKQIVSEKEKLDYILKGAELLASMLLDAVTNNESQKSETRHEVEYSEPGLETASGTGKREPV